MMARIGWRLIGRSVITVAALLGALVATSLSARADGLKTHYLYSDGNSSSYLAAASNADLDHDGSYTTEAWIYIDSSAISGHIFTKGSVASGQPAQFRLTAISPSYVNGKSRLYLYAGGDGGAGTRVNLIEDIPTNQWVHIALVVSYDGANSNISIYLDGVAKMLNTNYTATTGSTTLAVAGKTANNTATAYLFHTFQGRIDEVRIWKKALTQSEITERMNRELTSSEIADASLMAYYNFNNTEAVSNKVYDQTSTQTNFSMNSAGSTKYMTEATTSAAKTVKIGELTFVKNSTIGGWDCDLGDLGTVNFQTYQEAGQAGIQATVPLPEMMQGDDGLLAMSGDINDILGTAFNAILEEPTEIRLKVQLGVSADLDNLSPDIGITPGLGVEIPFGVRLDPTRSHIRMYASTLFELNTSFTKADGKLKLLPKKNPVTIFLSGGLDDDKPYQERWTNMFGFIPGEIETMNMTIGLIPTAPPTPEYLKVDADYDVTGLGDAEIMFELDKGNPLNSEYRFLLDAEAVAAFNALYGGPAGVGYYVKYQVAKFTESKYAKFLPGEIRSVLNVAENGVTINRLGSSASLQSLLSGKTPTLTVGVNVKLQGLIDKDYGCDLGTSWDASGFAAKIGNGIASDVKRDVTAAIGAFTDVGKFVAGTATDAGTAVADFSSKMGKGGVNATVNFGDKLGSVAESAAKKIIRFGRKKKKKDNWDNAYDAWNLRCAKIAEVAVDEHRATIDAFAADLAALFELTEKTRSEREAYSNAEWSALETRITAAINDLYITSADELNTHMSGVRSKTDGKRAAMTREQATLYSEALAYLKARIAKQKEAVLAAADSLGDDSVSYGEEKDTVAGTIKIACDNSYELYVNGELVGTGSNWKSAQTWTVDFVDGENVIAVKGMDSGDAEGLIAEVTVLGQTYHTDATNWLVSPTVDDAYSWYEADYVTTSWTAPSDEGAYGASPWGTQVSGMTSGSSARWIWNSASSTTLYFRRTFEIATE